MSPNRSLVCAAYAGICASVFFTGCGKADKDKEEETPATDDGTSSETNADTGSSTDTSTDVAWSCPTTGAVAKGDRAIGIDILNTSETGSYADNVVRAKALGASFSELHVEWAAIEPTPNQLVDPGDSLALMEAVSDQDGLKLALTIRPIDLTGKTVPSDLASEPFNSEAMKTRFKAVIDFVMTKVDPKHLTSLQIGNEIDGYDTSAEPTEFWSQYGEFLYAMTQYTHTQYPGTQVGFTGTFGGMTAGALADSGVFSALADSVDVVGITYYPMNSAFTVRKPAVVGGDFHTMAAAFKDHKIRLQEVGYQTATSDASSERQQSEFFCEVFKAWDAEKSIVSINITRLQDTSVKEAKDLAGPYGIDDTKFLDYLRTLGLRTNPGEGEDKEAVGVIKAQAKARGF